MIIDIFDILLLFVEYLKNYFNYSIRNYIKIEIIKNDCKFIYFQKKY